LSVLNRRTTAAGVAMDELEKLQDNLKRYRVLRDLTTDERAIEAIEIMIRETEDRLAEIQSRQSK
jgi:hypothetical protein